MYIYVYAYIFTYRINRIAFNTNYSKTYADTAEYVFIFVRL